LLLNEKLQNHQNIIEELEKDIGIKVQEFQKLQ
jgi:hypothetical protein